MGNWIQTRLQLDDCFESFTSAIYGINSRLLISFQYSRHNFIKDETKEVGVIQFAIEDGKFRLSWLSDDSEVHNWMVVIKRKCLIVDFLHNPQRMMD